MSSSSSLKKQSSEKKPSFDQLGLSDELLSAVKQKGFTHPSPIQAQVIPLLLAGEHDVLGQAQTGTGKTAAFALPLLQLLDEDFGRPQALILAPTRELAIQVEQEIRSFELKRSLSTTVLYGGNNMREEIRQLSKNPTIVVGTPGRVHHHIRNRKLRLDGIRYFVLDEADEMLNFGFREEIDKMLKLTPKDKRVLFFSATVPPSIMHLVNKHLTNYKTVKVKSESMTNQNVSQQYYCLRGDDKFEALCRIMENEERFYAIVFCRTKRETDLLASQLQSKHLRAEAIHGDIDQNQREKILGRFRNNEINILVATDVAARGIDVAELNFVVNYSLPESFEAYTHRVGRTGRAGNKGRAITFVNGSEVGRLRFFERQLNVEIQKGKLPTIKSLIEKKEQHLLDQVEHLIDRHDLTSLKPLAEQLLEEGSPVDVVAAMLKHEYGQDFEEGSYRKIEEDVERSRSFQKKSFGRRGSGSRGPGPRRRSGGHGRGGSSGGGGYRPVHTSKGYKKK